MKIHSLVPVAPGYVTFKSERYSLFVSSGDAWLWVGRTKEVIHPPRPIFLLALTDDEDSTDIVPVLSDLTIRPNEMTTASPSDLFGNPDTNPVARQGRIETRWSTDRCPSEEELMRQQLNLLAECPNCKPKSTQLPDRSFQATHDFELCTLAEQIGNANRNRLNQLQTIITSTYETMVENGEI